jgi:hypothetical protein
MVYLTFRFYIPTDVELMSLNTCRRQLDEIYFSKQQIERNVVPKNFGTTTTNNKQ